jgi:microcystin-dependent protein
MHIHFAQASSTNANQPVSTGALLASAANLYTTPNALTALTPQTVTSIGGSQAHLNMQPFLTLSFCIALQGIFPSVN